MSPVRAALLNKIVFILALAGIAVAGNLAYAKFSNKIVPCGVGSGCADVSYHPSSMLMGLPVAVYGLAAYLLLAIIAAIRMIKGVESTRALGLASYAVATVGAIVSIGLQIYSITVIHATCDWCIASAAIMVILFIVQAMLFQSLAGVPSPESVTGPRKGDLTFLIATTILGIAGLVTAGFSTNNSGKDAPKYVGNLADIPKLVPDDANIMGPETAVLTIVEFGDLCCPACHKAYALVKDVMNANKGKIRFVFRHFPLINMHKNSYRASVYAEYAGQEGKFWQFIDLVNQTDPEEVDNPQNLDNMLIGLGLDATKASKAYDDEKSKPFERVYRDFTLGNDLGLVSTPTFFVVVPGERPISMQIGDILRMFDNDPKYRKLLGKE